jgi:hypothetical protein
MFCDPILTRALLFDTGQEFGCIWKEKLKGRVNERVRKSLMGII